jgi:hypothetical protein
MARPHRYIIFRRPLIEALRDGTLFEVRRGIKPQPSYISLATGPRFQWKEGLLHGSERAVLDQMVQYCPFGPIGTLVYVKEGWAKEPDGTIVYQADYPEDAPRKWTTPAFMRPEQSRYTIRIRKIWIERIQDVTLQAIINEGLPPSVMQQDHDAWYTWYRDLWNTINKWNRRGLPPYDDNPWVWALRFELVQ